MNATDSPVRRVEIEHADGTVRRATGDDAEAWADAMDGVFAFAADNSAHVRPVVDWETWTVERRD